MALISRRAVRLFWFLFAVSRQFGTAAPQDLFQLPQPPTESPAVCRQAPPRYSPAPQPDLIADLLKARKRYRLVIGAGEFVDDPGSNNRAFVEPTAVWVDKRLAELGYESLPSLTTTAKPYLTGADANKNTITAALKEMASVTQGQDFGIVYYIGHGNISANGTDLSLAVNEEPVDSSHGYRVSDLFGELQTNSVYRSSVAEIPHFFVVLDTCFSGTVAQSAQIRLETAGGVQRLVEIAGGGPIIPPQMALLTSTAPGSNSSAYELLGTGMSAFSYYFVRALKEDWSCSDRLARDGILTLEEMHTYLTTQLKLASDKGAVEAVMSPRMLGRDKNMMLAYRPEKYVDAGFRDLILAVLIQPSPGQTADVLLPGGERTSCSDATAGCSVPISKTYENSDLTVAVKATAQALGGSLASRQQTVKVADVLKGSRTVLGVRFQINQKTTGCNSPAIAGVGGDVIIDINAPCSQGTGGPSQPIMQKTSDDSLPSLGQSTSGANSPAVGDVTGNVRYRSGPSLSAPVQQNTAGSCSPAIADTHGSVTITCYGVSGEAARKLEQVPALLEQLIASSLDRAKVMDKLDAILGAASPSPTDWFHIYVVEKADNKFNLNPTQFVYSDIQKNSAYPLFRKLLGQIPHGAPLDSDFVIFRLRDEKPIDATTDATANGNLGVLVIPGNIVREFGSSHLAFAYFKSVIDRQ